MSSVFLSSPLMLELFTRAQRVAQFPSTVLIEGETGVGKEVLANWIHEHSTRSNMPFTKVNCASIPETLLESELFGYERGAFTGAKREGHPGLFEVSDNGTLLLDEIGELPPNVQAKLLRVLQEREVRRVGGSWSRNIDVRIIASTNQNLRELVQHGGFRQDLYYRLNVINLYIPPLRQRREDIETMIRNFFEQISREFNRECTLSNEVVDALLNYDYPGNVRELRNLVEGLIISAQTNTEIIGLHYLPPYVLAAIRDKGEQVENGSEAKQFSPSLHDELLDTERRLILAALAKASSVRQAAKSLRISHSTLIRKMNRHNIKV